MNRDLKKVSVIVKVFGVVAMLVCFSADFASALEKISDAQVKAVTTMLSDVPQGVGRPISDRETWQRLAECKAFKDVVRKAERLLKTPIPEQPDDLYLEFSRNGNRSRWEHVAKERRMLVGIFTMAECLENRGRFAPALAEIIRELCTERTWVIPAHDRKLDNFNGKEIDIDLGASSLGWELATAYYLLGEKLGPESRQLVAENVRRRILAPFMDMVTGKRKANWWLTTRNNWNSVKATC